MRPRRHKGTPVLAGFVLLLAVGYFLFLPATHADPWEVTGETGLWRFYELPGTKDGVPVSMAIYYSVAHRQFYLETLLFKKSAFLNADAVKNAKTLFYRIDPETGDAGWPAETVLKENLYKLVPGKELLVSSSLTRNIGEQTIDQPFGDLQAKTITDEITYNVERKPGFPFFGKPYIETLGDGTISLELLNGSAPPRLVLKETYKENSREYSARFSPDGRFLLITLPDEATHTARLLPGHHRFLIAGPLPVHTSVEDVLHALQEERQEAEEKRRSDELKRQYRDGEIDAEEFYGPVFASARDKILQCENVKNKIGEITELTLQKNVLDFGNPKIVGKSFTFAYKAERGNGRLSAIALHPEFFEEWAPRYKAYLESVDLHTDSGTFYVSCPANPGE